MATQASTTETSGISKVLRLVGFMKSLDDAALRDLEQIDSVVQDHVQPHTMPTTTEVDTARSQAMRGGRASPEVDAHSDLQAQQGLTQMYVEFDRRLAAMEKAHTGTLDAVKAVATAVKAIGTSLTSAKAEADKEEDEMKKAAAAAAVTKAEDEKKAAEEAAKANSLDKAFRKARMAVAKAVSDEEEDVDAGETMEKAQAALTAIRAMIAKAEDEAESDEDESKIEKARQDLKTLKSQIAKFVAKKAAAAATPVVAATPAVKADHADALADFAKARGMTVNDLFASMGQAPSTIQPPVFAKAAIETQTLTLTVIDERIENAADAGSMSHPEIMKARTLKSRLAAVRAGNYDAANFAREMDLASSQVQALFAVPAAA